MKLAGFYTNSWLNLIDKFLEIHMMQPDFYFHLKYKDLYRNHIITVKDLFMLPITEIAGFTANILSNVAFVPQIIKSYRRKKVDDVSITMFLVLFTTQLCWIIYSVPLGARNLWTSSLIEIALLLPIFAMWFRYRNRGC